MLKLLEVADMKCIDESSDTKGVRIACGPRGSSCVTLVFQRTVTHKETDDLVHLLRKMKLKEVILQTN